MQKEKRGDVRAPACTHPKTQLSFTIRFSPHYFPSAFSAQLGRPATTTWRRTTTTSLPLCRTVSQWESRSISDFDLYNHHTTNEYDSHSGTTTASYYYTPYYYYSHFRAFLLIFPLLCRNIPALFPFTSCLVQLILPCLSHRDRRKHQELLIWRTLTILSSFPTHPV